MNTTYRQALAQKLGDVRREYGVRLDAQERAYYAQQVKLNRYEEAKAVLTRGETFTDAVWRDLARTYPLDWRYLVKIAGPLNVGPRRPLTEYEHAR